ncbi:MAG TPA: aminotransferase class V-fold PLP-dependent enzyme [Bacilli bacterium]|nr:aminotransferase class V-fold PLP-dependent enzyme [Bacilli bacterium]
MTKTTKPIIFAVGPVTVHPDILEIGSEEVPYFITDEFYNLMRENETLLKKYFHAPKDSKVAILTSSGSAAMDATVVSLLTKDDHVLIVNGGTFGQRFIEICEAYNIRYTELKLNYGEALKAAHLEKYATNGFTGLLINMHETSTGLLYDMGLIRDFVKKHNLLLIIDAISAFVSDEIDMEYVNADAIITGAQKGLALPPGISIVALSPRAINIINRNNAPAYYLNLQKYIRDGMRGAMPFTPAVTLMRQLNLRLNNFKNGNFKKEQEKIKRDALRFRERIKKYPFAVFSENPSYCLTPLRVKKEGLTGEDVINYLRENHNIILAASIGDLKEVMFRVGHIGDLKESDYAALFAAFDDMVAKNII